MLLKIRELTYMEGAQLGEGFDPQPGGIPGEFTGAGNRFFLHACDGIKKQKIRQSRIYFNSLLFSHAKPLLSCFPGGIDS